ncbi:MAG: hypothetical protein AAEJ53_11745 [Myxococcota bacterium]
MLVASRSHVHRCALMRVIGKGRAVAQLAHQPVHIVDRCVVPYVKGTATPTFVGPGFSIPAVHEKFDASGALIDDMTRLRLSKTLEDFCSWAETRKD